MVSAIHSAVSGLHAASRRVEAAGSNVANARNSIAPDKARVEPAGRPAEPRAEDEPLAYEPVRVHQDSVASGGVRSRFVPVEPPHVLVHDPDDRLANADGVVARPNVDYATEFVNLSQAEHAYKANLKTIETENKMIGALLNEEL